MRTGRRGATLAATLAPRLRWLTGWVVGGAGLLFVANLSGGWAMALAVTLVVAGWGALAIDGLVRGWRLRRVGLPALLLPLLPIVALPFAGFLVSHALYWSHVAPSWWRLRQERGAFDRAAASGPVPAGIVAIERSGRRIRFARTPTTAIVFDPTDRMAAARGWNGGPVAPDVARAFSAPIIWCQRLDSRWFHCQFD